MIDKAIGLQHSRAWRLWLVCGLLALIAFAIVAKLVSLYTYDRDFLQTQGDKRSIRTMKMPAHRGVITDRNGETLAVSAPVAAVWANPQDVNVNEAKLKKLAKLLDKKPQLLIRRLKKNIKREFLYIKRQISPDLAAKVVALGIKGINIDREYKRYYPAGEVATHLVGFTGIDGAGQEGIELAYENALLGSEGKKLVMQDRLGRVIKNIKLIEEPETGNDIALSIDLRLQYLAYKELKSAVKSHKADSASVVILDVQTGEVLAMVNQPSYNPNDRSVLTGEQLRNRALTDVFEPGSTVKPFTIAAAIMSGKYNRDSIVATKPGYIFIKGKKIKDFRNYGDLTLTRIITKSSNVGVTKLALSLEPDTMHNLFSNVGIGELSSTGFPGERSGELPYYSERQVIERAVMSYGYGLSVTPIQLAQAYAVLANNGVKVPVSLLKIDEAPRGTRIIPKDVANDVVTMMETTTQIDKGGTGRKAAVFGYRVAGKTGTARKANRGGYDLDKYISVFAGITPASNPRIAVVVMVNNPKGQQYSGGGVAAPIFSRVTTGALRMLNISPDQWPKKESEKQHLAVKSE
ncbi:MAG: cell division protein FtsI (penicillin-binding protein 3) [Oceanospirillaceae bacterium]|jgi:cell division protein FtsI (penicillin-binding protein 3)